MEDKIPRLTGERLPVVFPSVVAAKIHSAKKEPVSFHSFLFVWPLNLSGYLPYSRDNKSLGIIASSTRAAHVHAHAHVHIQGDLPAQG